MMRAVLGLGDKAEVGCCLLLGFWCNLPLPGNLKAHRGHIKSRNVTALQVSLRAQRRVIPGRRRGYLCRDRVNAISASRLHLRRRLGSRQP